VSDRIRIRREELFTPQVNKALEKERRLRGRAAPPTEQLPVWRRVLMSSLFYLPLAGLLGAFLAWVMIEPHIGDVAVVGGEVVLVNTTPFMEEDVISLTIGPLEVMVPVDVAQLEPGAEGQPAFASIRDIQAGTYLEAAGMGQGTKFYAGALRPATPERARATGTKYREPWGGIFTDLAYFSLTATMIALFLIGAEGATTRNWTRMVERAGLGTLLAAVLAAVAWIPAYLLFSLTQKAVEGQLEHGVHGLSGPALLLFMAGRSVAWAMIGCAAGAGMNLIRSTKGQLLNSLVGGALGGALGGVFFDPIERFFMAESAFTEADFSRMVGNLAVGFCIGLFVALVDQLAREAWVRVRTGPLAGKAFVLYRSPTVIGSAPDADIYLFKDAEISAHHASIHRVGNRYEIEDTDSRMGTRVQGTRIRRQRLESGNQVVVGATVLEFEERAKPARP